MNMKKISFSFVASLGYFDFYHTKINGVPGVAYILCNRLTEAQKGQIKTYHNTTIGTRTCVQAPEIVHDILFVGNKNF